MDPAIPISLSIGFALRMFLLAFGHKTIARPLLVGTWEGIALYRGLSASSDSQLTAYLACALRLMFDLFFTENIRTMMMILFSLVLAILFSDALGSHRSHDIQASRLTSSRRNRVSGNHTSEVHRVSNSRRLNQARLVDRPRTHHHAVNVDGQRVIRSPVVQTRNGASVGGIPVRIDHTPEFLVADVVSPHDSPPSVHTISTHPLGTLNTRYLPSIPSEPGSPCQDEVQSPAPLAMPQTLHSNLDEMAVPGGNIDQGNGDEHVVQTPLYMQVHRPPETADSPAPLSDDVSILQWLTAHKSMLDGALHPHSNLNEVAVQTEGILEDRGDQDVLQTPLDASLAVPQTPQNDIAVQTEDILEDHGDEDLLQTPLDASLAVPQTQPPSLNDIAVQTEDILEDHGDDDTYQTPLDKNVYNPPKALGSAGPSSEEADSDPLPLRLSVNPDEAVVQQEYIAEKHGDENMLQTPPSLNNMEVGHPPASGPAAPSDGDAEGPPTLSDLHRDVTHERIVGVTVNESATTDPVTQSSENVPRPASESRKDDMKVRRPPEASGSAAPSSEDVDEPPTGNVPELIQLFEHIGRGGIINESATTNPRTTLENIPSSDSGNRTNESQVPVMSQALNPPSNTKDRVIAGQQDDILNVHGEAELQTQLNDTQTGQPPPETSDSAAPPTEGADDPPPLPVRQRTQEYERKAGSEAPNNIKKPAIVGRSGRVQAFTKQWTREFPGRKPSEEWQRLRPEEEPVSGTVVSPQQRRSIDSIL